MFIFADFHTHTRHSHGRGTVEQNVLAAVRRGLKSVAISDHGPANLFGVGVKSLRQFDVIAAEIAEAQTKHPDVDVLLGVEANVVSTDGDLDIPPEWQSRFDVVLAGLHLLVRPRVWRPMLRLWGRNALARYHTASHRKARQINTDALIAAIHRNRIDIVTHPGYRLDIDTRELAKATAQTGTALEINTGHDHIGVEYIRLAAEEGARFVIGSDAHQPQRVGDFTSGIELARAAGLTVDQVVNAVASERDVAGVHSNPFRVHSR